MTGTRDYQRSKVYAWENRVIAPRAGGVVSFSKAQGMVDAIWTEMGLKYPPAVEPLSKQATTTIASANRLAIFLPEDTQSWCLFHELAHAMTSTIEGQSDGHGKLFVGIYLRLIIRYLRIDESELVRSLDLEGIQYSSDAQPTFLTS